MPTFNANHSSFTPVTTALTPTPNWCIDTVGTGVFGKVVMFSWGGQETTSTAYSTRWVRPTTSGVGAKTAVTIGFAQPNYTTAACTVSSSYATSQPLIPAASVGDLWNESWNGQGGVGAIALPLNNPWWISTGVLMGAIVCANVTGSTASASS